MILERKVIETLTEDLEKCTRQFALIVSKNVPYHLSQTELDLFTAESATKKEDPQDEDIRLNSNSVFN